MYKYKNFAIALLFIFGLFLRLFLANTGNYFFLSDEGRDVLVAKHLASGSTLNTTIAPHSSWNLLPHTVLYYDALSVLYRYIPHPIYLRFIIAILSSTIILIAYKIGSKFGNVISGLMSATVVTTSFVLISYSSHVSQIALTPFFVSLSLYFLIFLPSQRSSAKKTLHLFLSIFSLSIGLILHSSMLTVFPFFMIAWLVYLYKNNFANIWYRSIFYFFIFVTPIIFLYMSSIDIFACIHLVRTLGHSFLSKPHFQSVITNITLFYNSLETGWILGIGSLYAFFVMSIRKRMPKHLRMLLLLFGILIGGILVTASLPFEIFHLHYFSALYIIALLLFSLLLSIPSSKYLRCISIILVLFFVFHSLMLVMKNVPRRYSYYDGNAIAEAINRSSYVQHDQTFSIILPLSNEKGLQRIANWFAGSFWYALEDYTKKQFVQVVPDSENSTNIRTIDSQNRYILICIDDPKSTFYRLDICRSDWDSEYKQPIRLISRVNLSDISYSIFETFNE